MKGTVVIIFINDIGLEIREREDNLEIFKEGNLVYLMNGHIEIEKVEEMTTLIFEQLKFLSLEEIEEKVTMLFEEKDEVKNVQAMVKTILKSNSHKEVKAENYDKEIKEITLSQIINENYINLFKRELMNKKLYYLNEKDLYENVYYKAIEKIITEEIEKSTYQEVIPPENEPLESEETERDEDNVF